MPKTPKEHPITYLVPNHAEHVLVWVQDENSTGEVVNEDGSSVFVKLDSDGVTVSCAYEQVVPLGHAPRYARCERCEWVGPIRDDWADAFIDLAKHNRMSGHGPLSTGESSLGVGSY